jgi:integral membrane sensor domain MASE1
MPCVQWWKGDVQGVLVLVPTCRVRRYYAASCLAAWQLGAALLVGRLLAASVEVWVLVRYVHGLLLEDVQRCAVAED